jgi:hypothetical protein
MKKFLVLSLILFIGAGSCDAFSFGWKKNKETKTQAPEPVEYDNQGSGYVGDLPDISKSFKTSEPKTSKPSTEASKKFNSSDEIKPVPRDNPAFVNIILKTDKTSPYLNDINDLLPQLENLLLCIEKGYDVQKFNAKAYFFNQTVKYLEEKYLDKPESSFESFKKIQTLSTHTQSVATLRSEAEKYRPYLAYTGAGYLYNDNVINEQLDYLKTEIEDTIVVIKDAK